MDIILPGQNLMGMDTKLARLVLLIVIEWTHLFISSAYFVFCVLKVMH